MSRLPDRSARLALGAVLVLLLVGCGAGSPRRAPTALPRSPVWQRAAPADEGIERSVLAEADRRARTEFRGVTGFLVARHGRLVFERYYRGVRAADHLAVFSITKTVISALVGIALADRKLWSVDDRLVDLLPQAFGRATDPQARLITLRHLLTMTGGFVAFARYRSEDPVPALINRPVFHEPGTTFSYDSGSSDLLSAVVTRATGMTAAAYARLRLFGPVGIRGARWASQGAGLSEGGSGLMLRPRDLLAFGQLYLDSGRWRGRQVVPSAWVAASTRTRIPLGHGRGYGYDWWTEDAPVRSFAALGYPGQAIIVFPRLDEVVVVTSAGEDFRPRFVLAQMVVRATRH